MSTMPFGKFVNQEIENVPSNYLEWLYGEEWFHEKYEKLADDVKHEMDVRARSYTHFYSDKRS